MKNQDANTARRIFGSDEEETESEDSCIYNHGECSTWYKTEDDKRYWKEGGYLYVITYMGCKKNIKQKG